MSIINGTCVREDSGGGGIDTGDIAHSLRFRRSASAYLSRTFGTPTNPKKYTLSFFIKRGALGTLQALFDGYPNGYTYFAFNASDQITIAFNNVIVFTSSSVFRDPTAHLHIRITVDTAQAAAIDRLKVVVDNEEIAGSLSNIGLNADDTYFNAAGIYHLIGQYYTGNYGDYYLSRICMVDNYAPADSTDFIYFNSAINEWVSKSQSEVKAVVDAGGTNSFMLDFDDGTSLTTLGYDKSSKGNNWTLNNFSLTPGANYDWMLDVPGNSYATLNPLFMNAASLSAGNLVVSGSARAAATIGITSGKWYWEAQTTSGSYYMASGLLKVGAATSEVLGYGDSLSWGWYASTGQKWFNSVNTVWGSAFTSLSDRLVVAFDADVGELFFYKNGVLQGGGAAFTGLTSGPYFLAASINASSSNINCGQQPITDSALQVTLEASGFKQLCQANLPTPAILNPREHFDVASDTGSNAPRSAIPFEFFPGLLIEKSRNNAYGHVVTDSVRGDFKYLETNTTAAEISAANSIGLIDGGYSVSAGSLFAPMSLGNVGVVWAWKAGGAPVTNNAGSIASQVSANVDAGFSIVTTLGSGAAGTIGHGLLNPPELIIGKGLDALSVTSHWPVYHEKADASPANGRLLLNTADAWAADAQFWNNVLPTSSVFSVGANNFINQATKRNVFYCFHSVEGYSKVTSAVLNGSADGNYIDFGFKPAMIMAKCISTTSNWFIWDGIRSPDNPMNEILYPNLSNAEATSGFDVDATAFGAKIRTAQSGTWIFYAIADVSAKYSLAR